MLLDEGLPLDLDDEPPTLPIDSFDFFLFDFFGMSGLGSDSRLPLRLSVESLDWCFLECLILLDDVSLHGDSAEREFSVDEWRLDDFGSSGRSLFRVFESKNKLRQTKYVQAKTFKKQMGVLYFVC